MVEVKSRAKGGSTEGFDAGTQKGLEKGRGIRGKEGRDSEGSRQLKRGNRGKQTPHRCRANNCLRRDDLCGKKPPRREVMKREVE